MPRKAAEKSKLVLQGAELLRQVFPLLATLSHAGTERDRAKNRQFRFSQYAGLILVSMFNPILGSARSLVEHSGLKSIQKLTGGSKVSLGSFSEAARVFDPRLLEGIVWQLREELRRRKQPQSLLVGQRLGNVPEKLVDRLVAVDGSVFSAMPQMLGRMKHRDHGQWRLHVQVQVLDRVAISTELTPGNASGKAGERAVLADHLQANTLYLLDRGYRGASLFNQIQQAGSDYVARLNRNDGRVTAAPPSPAGSPLTLPPLSAEAQEMGVIADEWIQLGGGCGASPIGTRHPVRRITLIPPADRSSSARQGRERTDQGGRDELVLATTLVDLPAEQIVKLYEYRWQVELFFRFLKQVLGCKQLLSTKQEGVQIQIYCALIAALLLALCSGGSINRRQFERICLYLQGWADEEELLEILHRPP